ncbi:hypothetical protein IJT93_02015 [bacterium]|nr:hypothetical protein [bacterium]
MVIVHLLCALIPAALWYFSEKIVNNAKAGFFVLLLHGCRGSLLAVSICMLLAAVLGNSLPLFNSYDRSNEFFAMLSVGFSFIGVPIGFLVSMGIAKNKVLNQEEQNKEKK